MRKREQHETRALRVIPGGDEVRTCRVGVDHAHRVSDRDRPTGEREEGIDRESSQDQGKVFRARRSWAFDRTIGKSWWRVKHQGQKMIIEARPPMAERSWAWGTGGKISSGKD